MLERSPIRMEYLQALNSVVVSQAKARTMDQHKGEPPFCCCHSCYSWNPIQTVFAFVGGGSIHLKSDFCQSLFLYDKDELRRIELQGVIL